MRAGVLLTVVVACGGAMPTPVQPRIVMTNPGNEPRHLLRYAFHRGQVERREMDIKVAMTMAGQRIATPSIRTTIETTVLDVAADGSARIASAIVAAAAVGEIDAQGQRALAEQQTLIGTHLTWTASSRGETSNLEIAPGANVLPALQATLRAIPDQSLQLLPVEAVGVGARWETTLRDQRLAEIEVTLTTQLVAADDTSARLVAEISGRGDSQTLPNGIVIKHLAVRGHSDMSWTSATLGPVGAIAMTFQLLAERGGREAAMNMEFSSGQRIAQP